MSEHTKMLAFLNVMKKALKDLNIGTDTKTPNWQKNIVNTLTDELDYHTRVVEGIKRRAERDDPIKAIPLDQYVGVIESDTQALDAIEAKNIDYRDKSRRNV